MCSFKKFMQIGCISRNSSLVVDFNREIELERSTIILTS